MDVLYSVQGSGTYVKSKLQRNMYELKSFKERYKEGSRPTSEVLEFRMESPSEKISETLKLGSGVKVYYVRRLRSLNQKVIILEDTWMPVDLFEDLTISIMQHSKYDYVENIKHFEISHSLEKYVPILPPDDVAKYLGISMNTPILKIESKGYLKSNRIFDYTEEFYKSDDYEFYIETTRAKSKLN